MNIHKQGSVFALMARNPWLTPALAFLFFGSLLPACQSGPPNLDLSGAPSPEALLDNLRKQAQTRQNLRALGRVTANTPEGRIRLRTVVLAERPGRFRFETLTPFEVPIDVMTSDGEQLWYLHESRLYTGPATAENVALLLPLPMRAPEVVDTLLGGAPVSERFVPVRVESDPTRWILVLLNSSPTGPEGLTLWIEPDRLRVTRAQLKNRDDIITDVRFDRFETFQDQGPELATSLEIKFPKAKSEVRLRLTETETDVPLNPALFRIDPPAGSSASPLTELTTP